ncbi:hypothetical protein CJA_2586 [Cellvibrio japonicus Ueda107]|uniref:Uncharacterized protein n=1 Tax=Cellvibrio japonicus (strain Ueda107) TaxID=498211 RepID=B3PLG5_CELJU|nr:hypothetical protein CJA_2586 [Cellvibrio japonicus Ueda107]
MAGILAYLPGPCYAGPQTPDQRQTGQGPETTAPAICRRWRNKTYGLTIPT